MSLFMHSCTDGKSASISMVTTLNISEVVIITYATCFIFKVIDSGSEWLSSRHTILIRITELKNHFSDLYNDFTQ